VTDGMQFILVDLANGATIASVTVSVAGGSMPPPSQITFTANPNPIVLPSGVSLGKTTLSWFAPGHSSLNIYVNALPYRQLLASGLPSSGTISTGAWVTDGMPFFLVDAVNNQTLASLSMSVILTPMATISVSPITAFVFGYEQGGQSGVPVTIAWNAPGYSDVTVWSGSPDIGLISLIEGGSSGSTVHTFRGPANVSFELRQTAPLPSKGALLATGSAEIVEVPLITENQLDPSSCTVPGWGSIGPYYGVSPNARTASAWVPLDNAKPGDVMQWYLLDSQNHILSSSTALTLSYGGKGACAWWPFPVSGTSPGAIGVTLNGTNYGVSNYSFY
jgi:hypothetical protein